MSFVNAQVADTAIQIETAPAEVATDDEEQEEAEEERFEFRNPDNPYTSTQRNVPSKDYNELKNDDAFWYANGSNTKAKTKPLQPIGSKGDSGEVKEPPKIKESERIEEEEEEMADYTPLGRRTWFKNLMLILAIVGFAAILGWYLLSSNIGLFRKKDIKLTDTGNEEDMPVDIFSINYVDEVDKAVADGNYRLAIRLQYLRLLRNMAEKNIINYKQDKTNFDYLSELYNTTRYEQFFRITRHYEFSWYGKFDVSPEAYRLINQDFTELNKKLTQ